MSKPYSQLRAMLAITKASLRAIFRSPSAVIFSFAFPLIFILVFGFIGGGSRLSLRVAFDKNTDTTTEIYHAVRTVSGLNVVSGDERQLKEDLEKGRLNAIIGISKSANSAQVSHDVYNINITSSDAVNPQNIAVLRSMLDGLITVLDKRQYPDRPTVAVINNDIQKVPGRVYRTIDFILPGQLGFSLLSAGVFGVAFIFFSLRQTLVLKRFFATPVRRSYIVFGEALSRVIFQLSTAIVILLIGHFAFNFTLIHGFSTLIELLVLSFIGLAVFMGFGFVVSGVAKNESSIPPFANLFT
ncbi:MAG: ABC transporter permease, partial [Chitinophagaceae bacterium]|nr:ABC transporter permease [Chitinophagaceae bacterium]